VIACRHEPRHLVPGLGAGSLIAWALIAWGVMPRWDAHFQRPLRELAVSAAAQDQGGERLLLVGLRRRPSVVFYSGRAIEYASGRSLERLAARLAGPPPRLAIASESVFAALARGLPVEAIARDTGFVLFRAAGPHAIGGALP
jgi:hypothetical protein